MSLFINMEKNVCEHCGQEIKEKKIKRKTMDIWKSINELLGMNFENYDESIRSTQTQKELIKLEEAIKKIK